MVLGILSAIVVFSVAGIGDRGQAGAFRADARTVKTAEEAHFATFGRYVDEADLVGTFLSEPSEYHDVVATEGGRSYLLLCAPDVDCGGPARGGTLIVGLGRDPGSLNPAVTTNGSVHEASELMFNGLVGVDEAGEIVPELAESWTIDDAGRTATFRLRPGVTWHDDDPLGTRRPFTSADVRFTFEEALFELHSRARASLKQAVASIDTPDPQTVVFRLNYPYAPLLFQLDVTEAPILPAHVYAACSDLSSVEGCPANRAPVGTGPFELAPGGYTATEIRLVRNPGYFRAPWPLLDEVVERFFADPAERTLALEEGTVDWVWGVPGPDQTPLLQKGLTLVPSSRGPGGANCLMTFGFNLSAPGDRRGQTDGPDPGGEADPHPILGDVSVRRAIASALDRPALLDTVHYGVGSVATAPISSAIPWAHAEGLAFPPFNIGTAEALLEEAGWSRPAAGATRVRDGVPLVLDFVTPDTGDQFAYGALVKQQLELVGIDVTQKALKQADYEEAVFTERDFDTSIFSSCHGDDPEIGVRRQYDSSQISTAAFGNAAGYRNAEVDALFADAAAEPSQAVRGALYREIQELVADDLPYVWMVETLNTRAHRTSCVGFNPNNTGLFAERAACAPPPTPR